MAGLTFLNFPLGFTLTLAPQHKQHFEPFASTFVKSTENVTRQIEHRTNPTS